MHPCSTSGLLNVAAPTAAVVFKAYDLNGDSFVCKEDFLGMLKAISGVGMSEQQLAAVAAATVTYYDRDGDGRLSQPEFAVLLADDETGAGIMA